MKLFLDRVREEKEHAIHQHKALVPEALLREQAALLPIRSNWFSHHLRRSPGALPSILAEVKMRAPGRINVECDEVNIKSLIQAYEAGGARGISVLTDEIHFGGSLERLGEVRRLTTLPLLHKEFIIDPYQLWQGRALGANAALLLAYYFEISHLKEMMEFAHQMGVEPVVECSLIDELPKALAVNPKILLLNNRPIAALPENPTGYDRGTIANAAHFWDVPELRSWKQQPDRLMISASCIETAHDFWTIATLPYDAVLIGNSVSQASDKKIF